MGTFTYSDKNFLMNGKPFRVISGAIHYFRVVPEYWEDRLKKLRACGFNTVETYVPWNLHEKTEGVFDFSGGLDIVKFIKTAQQVGLYVIVRPGPYICAEFDFGGLPSWLLKENIPVRCNDERYLNRVLPYYRELFERITPLQFSDGGPIIMLQVENEYGSYGDDKAYLEKVRDIYKELGVTGLMYTSDGGCMWMLSGGTIDNVPCVVNFGSNPMGNFAALNDFRPGQPEMCGEFWCGWFDHWGEEHHTRSPEETLRDLVPMIECGASFNFYMFHGGTNFGFTNGANHTDTEYQPTVTSYDYCAPLSEAGDMTDTYYAVRNELAKICEIPEIKVKNSEKAAYGELLLSKAAALFDNLPQAVTSPVPLSMEDVGQNFGFIMYSTEIKGPIEELPLIIENVRDRGQIFINGEFRGIIERTGRQDPVAIKLDKGETARLDILVENCGRVNYGVRIFDKKGIVGGVRLGQRFHFGWKIYPLPMENEECLNFTDSMPAENMPAYYKGILKIEGEPKDTFVKPEGFENGFVKINGFNLGRFRNSKGPQKTLYVPAPVLKKGDNEVLVFETDCRGSGIVRFTDKPEL